MAVDKDDWVIYDEDQDTYYMTQDDALYLHRAAPETDGGTAVNEDAENSSDADRTSDGAGADATSTGSGAPSSSAEGGDET
jgi:hypothetical protein